MRLDLVGLNDVAKTLARSAKAGDRVYFNGTLGAGKTTFTRAFLHALGFQGKVKSPTFNWVDLYHLETISIAHFDLYRLEEPQHWESMGFSEYFSPPWVSLVEWFDKALDYLPEPMLLLSLSHVASMETVRDIKIEAYNARGQEWLEQLEAQ